MRNPEKRRNRQFNVGLTEAEERTIHERAAQSNMRPVDYGRMKLFGGRTKPEAEGRTHKLDPLFYAQLSRLGNNLNQIARKLHLQGHPAPVSLEPLLAQIRDLIAKATYRGS